MAKAFDENGSDGEERKLGEQKGLDTNGAPFDSAFKCHSLCE